MGEVYLAEDRQLHREVALKLVRRGMDTDDIVRHFEHEERLLASLNHPNIAQLYGSGVTATGFRFSRWNTWKATDSITIARTPARDAGAPPPFSQSLLGRHLRAPASGHSSRYQAGEHPRDGGRRTEAARLSVSPSCSTQKARRSGQTLTLQGVMTPEYASPEQVRGENITTASDVYSLGVDSLRTAHRPASLSNQEPVADPMKLRVPSPSRNRRVRAPRVLIANRNQQSQISPR